MSKSKSPKTPATPAAKAVTDATTDTTISTDDKVTETTTSTAPADASAAPPAASPAAAPAASDAPADIDITGYDLETLVKKAYELSAPGGPDAAQAADGPIPEASLQAIVKNVGMAGFVDLEHVNGRAVRLQTTGTINGRTYMQGWWIDHTPEQLEELIAALREQNPDLGKTEEA